MNQANNLAQVDVLAVLDRTVLYAEHAAIAARKIEKGELDCTLPKIKDAFQRVAENLRDAEQARAAVAELVAAARLIANGAMPATASGATCFVPRYEVEKLRAALRPFTGERA